jgi:hypothetical protein
MSWWILFFLALVTEKSGGAANPHFDPASGVNRVPTVPPTIGDCSQCHRLHGDEGEVPSAKTLFTIDDNMLCYTAGGPSGCHGALPAGYPATEEDRMPAASDAPGYFEVNAGGQRVAGVLVRRRWPGSTVYEDARAFGAGHSYSPHRNDVDMPRTDELGHGLCLNCHDPHEGRSQFDLTSRVYQAYGGPWARTAAARLALCLGCHSTQGPFGMDEENQRIADFYNRGVNPDGTAGHAIRKNPRVAISWPSHVRAGDFLPCYDCHNPHGSRGHDGTGANGFCLSDQRPGWTGLTHTRTDPAQSRRFCLGCHIPSDGVAGSQQVEGIVMNTLSNKGEHASSSLEGCFDCHGNDYASPTSFNVHHPARND